MANESNPEDGDKAKAAEETKSSTEQEGSLKDDSKESKEPNTPERPMEDEKMEVGSPEKKHFVSIFPGGAAAADQNSDQSQTPEKFEPEKKMKIEALPPLPTAKTIDTTNKESADFKVIFNKKKYDVSLPLDTDVGSLKVHLQPIIDIPPAMMKVMIKGLAKDDMTLGKLGVTKGSKIMVVGSSLNDVLQVSTKAKESAAKESTSASSSEENSTCKQKQHKKVLDKGKPDDVMPGIKGKKDPLPPHPISGMLNKNGGKVRLTFKLELDQVWIGTKERTEKLPLNSIRSVVSEPIEGHEEYHIVALQLGPTEASRYWIYWVPAQYVEGIKDAILGKWQFY